MFHFAPIISLVATALATLIEYSNGLNNSKHARIFGGTPAKLGEIPYQVSVELSGLTHVNHCGGSILSERFILTAAHCIDWSAEDYIVAAQVVDIKADGQRRLASALYVHPNFTHTMDGTPIYDIGLIELKEPLELNEEVQPIKLPAAGKEVEDGAISTVAGWGIIGENYTSPRNLMKAVVPIISKSDCHDLNMDYGGLPSSQICTNSPTGRKGPCSGDSGGPLVLDGVQIGIVSWTVDCATMPTAYTEVSKYIDFIDNIMQKKQV